ncbi:MAG: hypothetical protein IJZ16_04165 [Clostridia bacterium]|nr:hypothetical protein [Clostridia bacterium]
MRKFLSITLAVIMLFLLVACNKNEPDVEQGQNETKLTEWQEAYQSTFYEFLPMEIASAYISDTNGDGVPTIALSFNTYTCEYPDIILNYVDGKVVELPLQIDDYGSSVSEAIYFVNGTDDIVFRSYGATTGTFGENEIQKIYSITESGKYELVSEKMYELSDDMSKKYIEMLASGGSDLWDYQQNIFSQMDEELEKVTGVAPSLIDYKTVSVSFTNSSEDAKVDMEEAFDYINKMLKIKLTEDNMEIKPDIEYEVGKKSTFDAEEYEGLWTNADTGVGDWEVELYITDAKDDKLTCEFSYIRLYGYGPEVVEVGDDGSAKFEMHVDSWTYSGELIFMGDEIKLILDEATSPYPEIKSEIIAFERADYEENELSVDDIDKETTASAKAEAVASSKEKESTTKKQTVSSACTHKISPFEIIGNEYLGVENRTTVEPDCVNEGYEIYRCPDCMEMAIYKTIEPLGHDFSDEEEFVKYPSAIEDGAYGRRCKREKQNGNPCGEYVQTRVIPKRSGDYSSVDSCFSVDYYSGNQEVYTMDEPWIRIDDERRWGAVPTIKYNSADKSVYIAYRNQNNELIEVTEKYNEEYASQGYYMLSITLQDNGKIDIRYGMLRAC